MREMRERLGIITLWFSLSALCIGCDAEPSPNDARGGALSESQGGVDTAGDASLSPDASGDTSNVNTGGDARDRSTGGVDLGGIDGGEEASGGISSAGERAGGTMDPPPDPPAPPSTGFSSDFTRWAVPDLTADGGAFAPWYAQSPWWYSTMDLNGDGHPDLIQSAGDEERPGSVWRDAEGAYWKVWLGGDGGFADAPQRWSVPESGLDDGFFYMGWSNGTRWFNTRDLNGDGRPDLIQSADSGREGGYVWRDAEGAYWKVWWGRADGFASDAARWSVPESGLDDGFFALAWADGTRWFSTMDLNGDGRLDLVQTADPTRDGGYALSDDEGPYWRVWSGEASGFSRDALRWALPESGLNDGFFYTSWTQGERSFITIDLTGDGRPDLVQTADPERSGGYVWRDAQGPYWKVWRGTGRGFSSDLTRWRVPESGLDDGFFAAWWSQDARSFATLDLTGDGRPDLIQAADPDQQGGYVWRDPAGFYWRVWSGEAGGFAETPQRWSVPESGLDDGFFTLSWLYGERWFVTMDLNGDQRPDLAQTAGVTPSGGHVWRDERGPFWKVWLNR